MPIVTAGRSNRHTMSEEDEAKLREFERLREEYMRLKREEEAADRLRAAVEAHVIEVTQLEMYKENNAEKHHTNSFELLNRSRGSPILRRGQPFYICLRFDRQCDLSQDSVTLKLSMGSNPRPNKGTLIQLPVTANNSFTRPSSDWDVRLHHQEPEIMHLQIQISYKAAVGPWKFVIVTSNPNAPIPREYNYEYPIYILFNPWCKDDAVYMDKEEYRNEYVMNEYGKIFVGSSSKPKGRRWVYGQFSLPVLNAAMAILEKSSLDDIGRGSPVKVVRAISSLLNDVEDDPVRGVLRGQWQAPYSDGIAPWEWTGSQDILDRFIRNGYKAVKYGQCWVFAGVFTSICRALGIPCRTVSNYVSAHDTDDTLTIDVRFTMEGEKLENDDSVWNYHVWNDCWMTRPDLPPGYGGWQAVDATPQETSEGVYQMGPASLEAIKRGQVGYMYDSPFVFSEVNADVIHWKRDFSERLGWKKVKTNSYHIGRMILTKKPGVEDYKGDTDKEDIIQEYKNLEGTAEERIATRNAATHGNYAVLFDMPPPGTEDVSFDMLEIEKIMIGQPFDIVMHVENKSNEVRSITATLTAESVFYTGIKAHTIKHEMQRFSLRPKQKEVLATRITADEYYDKLVDYSMMKIYTMASVKETRQTWTEEDDFAVEKPSLTLQAPQRLQVGRPFELSATLTNPLTRALMKCSFVTEGPGLTEPRRSAFRDIKPEETIVYKSSFVPKKAGKRSILVLFSSEQLIDVQGSMEVEVFE